MTWDEFIKKVTTEEQFEDCKINYELLKESNNKCLWMFPLKSSFCRGIVFFDNGDISTHPEDNGNMYSIARNRTPDQMYQIIKALTETVKD